MFSKWVEVFPAKHANSHAVTKALLTDIIPRWSIPEKISSDTGAHFVNTALTEVGKFLGISLRTHCAYHPQRCRGKRKWLAKCCEETGLPFHRQ